MRKFIFTSKNRKQPNVSWSNTTVKVWELIDNEPVLIGQATKEHVNQRQLISHIIGTHDGLPNGDSWDVRVNPIYQQIYNKEIIVHEIY